MTLNRNDLLGGPRSQDWTAGLNVLTALSLGRQDLPCGGGVSKGDTVPALSCTSVALGPEGPFLEINVFLLSAVRPLKQWALNN